MNQQTSNTVDRAALRKLYQTDNCARIVLDYAAKRSKNSQESPVERLLTLLSSSESLFTRVRLTSSLKQLEKLGAGKYIPGRRGKASRFKWAVAMIGVGQAARGEEAAVIESLDDIETVEDDEPSPPLDVSEGLLRHTYKLRPDYDLSLDLPANFSAKEASRLSHFILTLPFDAE